MLPSEARWIGTTLANLDTNAISPLVELGSSTHEFRRKTQPYIYEEIDRPLLRRGINLIYCDSKKADGIDIAGDIFDSDIQEQIRAVRAKCILCCNIFEHIADRQSFASICDSLLAPGSCLLVTVPYSYPLHFDPIDTYFRPTPAEIHQMFPDYILLAKGIVKGESYVKQIFRRWTSVSTELFIILKRLLCLHKPRSWPIINHRLLWLFRRYKVSAVLLKKPLILDRP
jgi:hypothetical protein